MWLLMGMLACGNQSETDFTSTDQDVGPTRGDASISVEPESILFTELNPGSTYSDTVTLRATGEASTLIYSLRVTNDSAGAFQLAEDSLETLEIESGSALEVLILAALPSDEPAEAELQIQTNVSEAMEILVPLRAEPAGWEPKDSGGADTGASDSGDSSGSDSGSSGEDSGSSGKAGDSAPADSGM